MSRDKTGNEHFTRRDFLGAATLAAGAASAPRFASAAAAAAPGGYQAPLREVAGKVAFVTGGSSGIGLGQAHVFHEAGMKVAIGYIRDDQRDEAAAGFTNDTDRVHWIKADVTDRAQMKAAAEEVEKRFGKVHLVSANAGVGMSASVANATYTDYDWCLAVNQTGVFNTLREFLPCLRKHQEGAHFLATSSMNGLLPVTNGSAGIYTMTKFGVLGMIESLRAEFDATGERIGASAFCPGFVTTRIGEVDRNRTGAFAGTKTEGARAPRPTNQPARPAGAPFIGMDPIEAGRRVLQAVRNNELFIVSHVEFGPGIQERNEAIMASVHPEKPPADRVAAEVVNLRNPLYPAETARLRARRKI
jgi:NAD(P)-dependent dehydrogenase (short-subunit alcohol dehydrogenase family)